MATHQQETLTEEPRRARVWCTGVGCGRELTDPVSRARRKGPECDPEPRTGNGRQHDVDQDPIPGM
ncbi:MAG: hypothetical protein HOY75_08410 [Streptomyces sp.]|nr:hypothetical protein [Streptomyces sp.]